MKSRAQIAIEEAHRIDKRLKEMEKESMEEVRKLINRHDKEVRAKAIEEFVEKVVAELKAKKDEARLLAGKRAVYLGEDEYEEDPYFDGKKHAFGNAIEILERMVQSNV
jgi:hypothetical protein